MNLNNSVRSVIRVVAQQQRARPVTHLVTRACKSANSVNSQHNQSRLFSGRVGGEDSHSDFAPEVKVKQTSDDEVQEFLRDAINKHDVLLFMKGSPEAPQCGFSAQVAKILKAYGVDFSSADVLSSMEIRQGIKKFSDWPTVPQLYVNGEFIGGCDLVSELHTIGELEDILGPVRERQKQNKAESKP